MSQIFLSAAIRNNLLTLSDTNRNIDQTNTRLSSGLKVASAIDDPVAFFASKALETRVEDFTIRKDGIDQSISTLKAAANGVDALDKVAKQLKGVLTSAKTASEPELVDLTLQLKDLFKQYDYLGADASYQGVNLLQGTNQNIEISFSNLSSSELTINGRDLTSFGAFGTASSEIDASLTALNIAVAELTLLSDTTISSINDAIDLIDDGIENLRAAAKVLGSNITLLNTRLDFTRHYTNTLQEGSAKLRLADTNEEGANLVALQTRQSLGLQALAFAGQSERSVQRLFG